MEASRCEQANSRWDFYTIGYSQRTMDDFLLQLKNRGVATLVDIRYAPISAHRPQFSKNRLREALKRENIAYVHVPELGVPKVIRVQLAETDDWGAFITWYDTNVIPHLRNGIMDRLSNSATRPLAFMCVEHDPTRCHRSRVTLALTEMGWKGTDIC